VGARSHVALLHRPCHRSARQRCAQGSSTSSGGGSRGPSPRGSWPQRCLVAVRVPPGPAPDGATGGRLAPAGPDPVRVDTSAPLSLGARTCPYALTRTTGPAWTEQEHTVSRAWVVRTVRWAQMGASGRLPTPWHPVTATPFPRPPAPHHAVGRAGHDRARQGPSSPPPGERFSDQDAGGPRKARKG